MQNTYLMHISVLLCKGLYQDSMRRLTGIREYQPFEKKCTTDVIGRKNILSLEHCALQKFSICSDRGSMIYILQ